MDDNKVYIYQKINKINKLTKQENDIKKNLHNYGSEDLSSIMNELEIIEKQLVSEVNEYLILTGEYNNKFK